MQPSDSTAAAADAAPKAAAGAARARNMFTKAGSGAWKGAAAIGGLFKGAAKPGKPQPEQTMELQDMRGASSSHRPSPSLSSSIVSSESLEQTL